MSSARGRLPLVTLLLGSGAGVIALAPASTAALEYERHALAAGELWRVVTSHWTHWSVEHLVWNVAAFVALGAACECLDRRRFIAGVAAGALLITPVLWWLAPGMATYRGLSGIASTLFLLLATLVLRGRAVPGAGVDVTALAAGVAAAFIGKVSYEAVTGHALFVDSAAAGIIPVPLAHLVGGVLGVVIGLWGRLSPTTATQPGSGRRQPALTGAS